MNSYLAGINHDEMKKIAVTAASGQLGSSVLRQLRMETGAAQILGIARSPEKAAHLGIEVRKGDYNNRAELTRALEGVGTLLLISGMDHPDVRIGQHRNVIEAAREQGVEKIVYTSIIGAEEGNAFSPVVASNRQTEQDVQQSGLRWAIGRNGLYIEPDLAYIENYRQEGAITNSAADGRCVYTSRNELAYAYARLLTDARLDGQILNLCGEAVTQLQLAEAINRACQLKLKYRSIPVQEYLDERKAALGDFLGTIIGGIYEGIRDGKFDVPSDYHKVAGRRHRSLEEMITDHLASHSV